MEITASQVNELRTLTGAGLMLCKRALTECDGRLPDAVTWLRANGVALTTGIRAPGEGDAMAYDMVGPAGTIHDTTTEGCVFTVGNVTLDIRTATGNMHTVWAGPGGYLSVGKA